MSLWQVELGVPLLRVPLRPASGRAAARMLTIVVGAAAVGLAALGRAAQPQM